MKERIQQVLEIEKRAHDIRDAAAAEAEKIPAQAEREAREMLEKSRTDAREKARQNTAQVQSNDESTRILSQAEEAAKRNKALAMNNFDRAVAYVIERVIGKEQS